MKTNAKQIFLSGHNCAEAVAIGVLEVMMDHVPDCLPRIASGFGGGFGRTRVEICGALAGGAMAIGMMHGRDDTQADLKAKELTGLLHQKFSEKYISTHCQPLLDEMGPQENSEHCAALVGEVADMVVEILEEDKGGK